MTAKKYEASLEIYNLIQAGYTLTFSTGENSPGTAYTPENAEWRLAGYGTLPYKPFTSSQYAVLQDAAKLAKEGE